MAFNFFKNLTTNKTGESQQQKNYLESFHDKYRPKTLNDIIGQEHITNVLKKSLVTKEMPHLLFHGPPGCGKSSTIKALCNELYKNDIKKFVLHLNASDERGIGVVRDKIKHFAQFGSTITTGSGGVFKIIILDEADNITDDAQTALRRTIEIYSRTTRFCLICNHINNINHPLRSRCAIFRFKPLSGDEMIEHIQKTCLAENINLENSSIAGCIVDACDGDFRKILTFLEALKRFYQSTIITSSEVEFVSRVVPVKYIIKLLKYNNDFDYLPIKISKIVSKGYSGILQQLFNYILNSDTPDSLKKIAAKNIGICELRLTNGSDEYIQLLNLFSNLYKDNGS